MNLRTLVKVALAVAAVSFVAEATEWLIGEFQWYFTHTELIWSAPRVLAHVSRIGLPIVCVVLAVAFLPRENDPPGQ